MGFGHRGFGEIQPILIGMLAIFGGQDFYDLAIANMVVEGDHFAVCFGTDRMIADLAMNSIGEVDRSGFFGKLDDIAFGSEGEDMVFEKLNFQAFEKF
jgi:hypothetical protein